MFSYCLNDIRQASELIDIGKFPENHNGTNILQPYSYINDKDARKSDILQLMDSDIDDSYLTKLMKHCHDDSGNPGIQQNLLTSMETWTNPVHTTNKFKYVLEKVSSRALKFKTIQKLQERIQKDEKYQYKIYIKCMHDIIPKDEFTVPETPPDLIPGREVLIRIRVYCHENAQTRKTLKFSHDLIVLGSHTLDVLKDKIICPNDLVSLCDMSENPDLENYTFTKDIFKSGFLFIEDTFYNDTRDPSNIDYSENIIKWAADKKPFPNFKKATMENTTFNDLKIHLGYPQLYQHQGDCDHIFTFSDVELLQPSDICYSSRYPYYRALTETKGRNCNMCGLFLAKWYVKNNDRMPFNPSYFCDSCFRQYNYDDGKKIGNFQAYPYFDKGLAL
ncbi:proximal sequence element A Pbp49 [Arctopsyche grandis]|uniref:proximal sequence element A Pbp49 n=1 Tax=Arctopsyche grandis TaxID=121162 RepID=UPI00406D89D2